MTAYQGNYEDAEQLLRRAVVRAREQASYTGVIYSLCGLGKLLGERGDYGEAHERFFEAQFIAEARAVTSGVAIVGLADIATAEGDIARSRELLTDEIARARSVKDQRGIADASFALGDLGRTTRDLQQASTLHHEALVVRSRLGNVPDQLESLDAFGGVLACLDRHEKAARVLGSAEALRRSYGIVRAPVRQARFDQDVARVREGLGRKAFKGAWAEGSALSLADAVAYAGTGRGRRPRNRPPTGWVSITKAEMNVTELVADGLTSAQVAERLFVSRRTIDSHLQQIFAKLGLSSRTELAREVFERRAQRGLNGNGRKQPD